MKTFFCRLLPPRATFVLDMTPEEMAVMQAHAVYWRARMDEGRVVAFGLVADAEVGFGIGIVQVESDGDARALTGADPAILSGRGFSYDIHPMPRGVVWPGLA